MQLLLILVGFLSGVIGGMGMGGGTILVPLLSFLDLGQKSIQATNLISFLPMCIVALLFHNKNNLVCKKNVGWVIIPAVLFSVLGALLGQGSNNDTLSICFGVFLVIVGLWQMFVSIKFAAAQFRRKKHKLIARNLPKKPTGKQSQCE